MLTRAGGAGLHRSRPGGKTARPKRKGEEDRVELGRGEGSLLERRGAAGA